MIKIYGPERSSASRCRWAAEEVGVAYESVEVDMKGGEHNMDAYLKLNPNGYVPTMIDGDFVLWESFAINQYLAEKYAPALCGSTPEERGLVAQWSFWNTANLVPNSMIILHGMREPKSDEAYVNKARETVTKFIGILDAQLAEKDFLVANRFTLADLNVMSSISFLGYLAFDLTPFKNVTRWSAAMFERPAFKKASPKRN